MQQKIMPVEEQEIYAEALRLLNENQIHYVVSGAVALGHYASIWRDTKDLDLFLTPRNLTPALLVLAAHDYEVEITSPHWLAKARRGEYFVDLIHGFGGWRAQIDDLWWERGQPGEVHGEPVRIAPIEDLIWIKSYVAHRERFDLADVLHLLQAGHESLSWRYLIDRYGPDWQLLLFYLTMYMFVYPSHHADVPAWVIRELTERWQAEQGAPVEIPPVCRGTLLDRFSYLTDVDEGWADGRLPYVIAQGYTARDLAEDRQEAKQMLAEGKVRPEHAA